MEKERESVIYMEGPVWYYGVLALSLSGTIGSFGIESETGNWVLATMFGVAFLFLLIRGRKKILELSERGICVARKGEGRCCIDWAEIEGVGIYCLSSESSGGSSHTELLVIEVPNRALELDGSRETVGRLEKEGYRVAEGCQAIDITSASAVSVGAAIRQFVRLEEGTRCLVVNAEGARVAGDTCAVFAK